MEFVRSRLRHDVDVATAVLAELGGEPGRDDLELLHRILGDDCALVLRRLTAAPVAEERALALGAVELEARVRPALTRQRDATAVGFALHGRREQREIDEVAA